MEKICINTLRYSGKEEEWNQLVMLLRSEDPTYKKEINQRVEVGKDKLFVTSVNKPPMPWLERLSLRFPDLELRMDAAEFRTLNGYVKIKAGQKIEEHWIEKREAATN
jgi:hypothetical protein